MTTRHDTSGAVAGPDASARVFSAFVPIEPFAKERPEFIVVKDKKTGRMRGGAKTRDNTLAYETALKKAFMHIWGEKTTPLDGPLFAETWYYITRPKSVPKKRRYPDTKPDLDNLDKAALDSLDFTIGKLHFGAAIANDSRIVSKVSHKRYADTDSPYGKAGVYVRVRPMDDDVLASAAHQTRPVLCVVLPEGGCGKHLQDVVLRSLSAGYYPLIIPGGLTAGIRRRLVMDAEPLVSKYCVVALNGESNDLGTFVSEVGSRLDREVLRLAAKDD